MKTQYQIIIIDDEIIMTELLKLVVINGFNCEVEVFNDPLKALERLSVKSFDIISLDHKMPVLKGDEVIRRLRDEKGLNFQTPVVMFTGFKEDVKLGAQYLDDLIFLDKPIENDSYVRHVKMALRMKSNLAKKEGRGQANFFDIVG